MRSHLFAAAAGKVDCSGTGTKHERSGDDDNETKTCVFSCCVDIKSNVPHSFLGIKVLIIIYIQMLRHDM